MNDKAAASLHRLFPQNFLVPVLIFLSAVCLILGLTLPVLTFKEMIFWKHTFSVLTGIQNLCQEKHYGLAAIIFIFSVVFPIVKVGTLMSLWYLKFSSENRARIVDWVGQLGKWSMLDVFVVAITIVITRLSKTLSAVPRPGIYVFAASIFFAMAAVWQVERRAKSLLDVQSRGRVSHV